MESTAKTRLFAVARTFALLFAAVCLVMGALELILNDDAGVVLFLLLCASGMAISWESAPSGGHRCSRRF